MKDKNRGKKSGGWCKKGVIGLYICTGISLLCGIFMLYYSITYVQSYYEGYGMSISDGIVDVCQYVISSAGIYFGFAVMFFCAAVIIRKMDHLARQTQPELEESSLPQLEIQEKEPAAEETSDKEESEDLEADLPEEENEPEKVQVLQEEEKQ